MIGASFGWKIESHGSVGHCWVGWFWNDFLVLMFSCWSISNVIVLSSRLGWVIFGRFTMLDGNELPDRERSPADRYRMLGPLWVPSGWQALRGNVCPMSCLGWRLSVHKTWHLRLPIGGLKYCAQTKRHGFEGFSCLHKFGTLYRHWWWFAELQTFEQSLLCL